MSDIFNMADTWNNGATTFTAIKMDVTDTASNAASLLIDLQVGASSKFKVSKAGVATAESLAAKAIAFSGQSLTGSQATALLDSTVTWFTTGTPSLIKAVVTNTASDPASLLLDITTSAGRGVQQFATDGIMRVLYTSNTYAQIDGSVGELAFVTSGTQRANIGQNGVFLNSGGTLGWSSSATAHASTRDLWLQRDAAGVLKIIAGSVSATTAATINIYGSYTSATDYQRLAIKTVRESSGTLSGATYTSTATIPAYAVLIGVTTNVTTAITGATSYSVGDGTDVDLWGATIAVADGSQSRTANFTAVGSSGATGAARNVVLTANGSNFTGGVVEICFHYLTTEAEAS